MNTATHRHAMLIGMLAACLSFFPTSTLDAATVGFAYTNQWTGGGQAEFTITHQGTTPIEGWTLEFEWPAEISNLWNGVIVSHTGTRYVVRNTGYNATINPGTSFAVGCVANLTTPGVQPSNIKFNGATTGGGGDSPPSISIADASITLSSDMQKPGHGFLSTLGNQIIDSAGKPVRLTGINWFGFETSNRVFHGLWTRNYRQALEQIHQLGFNTLRIPFSNAMLREGAATNSINFAQNPDLQGLTPLQCLDKVIEHCGSIGLRVILDRHSAAADGYMNEDVWFIPGDPYHTEERWIADWVMLATRYAGNPTVIGADLFNEPKKSATWGDSSPATDWNKAAERCGNAILAANPHWLIIVEGVERHSGQTYWWGGNLRGVATHPVTLSIPNKLVYSMHDYPASVFNQTWFTASDYPANLPTVWNAHWAYLFHENTAPLLLGEFGSKLATDVDRQWLDKLTDFIDGDFDLNGTNDLPTGKTGISWTFWCFNPNSGDTGGILNDDWTTVNAAKLAYLTASMAPPPGTTPAPSLSFTIKLSAAASDPVSINWATADGTATAGSHYTAGSGTLQFAAGETTKTILIPIPPHPGTAARRFSVNLANPVGATISRATGTGTIHYQIPTPTGDARGKTQTGSYSYAEALQKSLWFYSAQRAGDLPDGFRVSWRGDAATTDGSDAGRDLTGGWFDAGDHVKFNFPMAASATLLAWGGIEYPAAYTETGLADQLREELRWVYDYFIRCHVADASGETLEFYGQVGNGGLDHAYWGPAETMTMARPAYKVTRSKPGSDLCAETAASLAAGSMLFAEADPAYAGILLSHARKLYQFAETYRGRYSDAITDAAAYYNSWSGYQDDLMWGALWLHRATGEASYLDKALAIYPQIFAGDPTSPNFPQLKWTHAWDDKTYGSLVLLSMLGIDPAHRAQAERWLDYWTIGRDGQRITYTPGGLAWLDTWGSLRYAANTAFLALVYSDRVRDYSGRYRDFATAQINYMLGTNPAGRSYVCGFGANPPAKPHHRGAHGSWNNQIQSPPDNRHVLHGALVGGPGNNDSYSDTRDNFINNEVACDYNAAFTGALARLYELHGGFTDPSFPRAAPPDTQFFVEASVNSSSANYTEIRALLNNRSAFPARASNVLQYRYFVDLSELYAAGGNKSQVTITTNMLDGGAISGLLPWDESRHWYYVEVRYHGVNIFPGGSTTYRREAQFRLTIPPNLGAAAWNPLNDWSYDGLLAGHGNLRIAGRIPTYENNIQLEGSEPPAADAWNQWRGNHFTTSQLALAALSGPLATPSGDGMPNLLKFALGGTPWTPASSLAPSFMATSDSMKLSFFRDTNARGVHLRVESAPTPAGTWFALATSGDGQPFEVLVPGASVKEIGTGMLRQVNVTAPLHPEGRGFMRLSAE